MFKIWHVYPVYHIMFNNLIEFIPHNCHEYMVVPSVVLIKRNIFAIALVYIHLMTSKASIVSHTHTANVF